MSRTGRSEETGHMLRKNRTPEGRTSVRKDMIEAVIGILLQDMDSSLDWIRSFHSWMRE